MNCCPDQIPPPNEKSSSLVNILRLLMFVQLIVGIVKMASVGPFAGFFDLISCLILYQGYAQLNYCNMIIIMFINGLNVVQLMAIIGAIIQDNYPWMINTYFRSYLASTISYVSFVLYIAICVASFYAYREFKALAYEGFGGSSGTQLFGQGGTFLPTRQQQQTTSGGYGGGSGGGYSKNRNLLRFLTLILGQERNEEPQRTAQPSSSNSGGAFQAFQGRGVTIG